jgi:hypothetical protein
VLEHRVYIKSPLDLSYACRCTYETHEVNLNPNKLRFCPSKPYLYNVQGVLQPHEEFVKVLKPKYRFISASNCESS